MRLLNPKHHRRVALLAATLVLAPAYGVRTVGSIREPGASRAPTMRAGDRWIRVRGRPGFVMGRNPTERTVEAFEERFREMEAAGESLARLHLMHGIPYRGGPGQIDESWAEQWERVFDAAERHGIAVLPVFTIWAQWNDGTGGELWYVWNDNPYNVRLGGPAASPAALLADTQCRRVWLTWLEGLVRRWQGRRNILAWEPISELDLVTGSTPAAAAQFIEAAAAVIRRHDRLRRPVTVSLSTIRDWPEIFGSKAVDIVQAHPYALDQPYFGRLADLIIDVTRQRLARYRKPVLLGECGLDWRPPPKTLTEAPRADVAIRHAFWAAAVSGAVSGRMLWWEDGYDKNERGDVAKRYRDAARPILRITKDLSYTNLRPAPCRTSADIKGAALAGPDTVVGWFRDIRSEPPDWPERTVTGAAVTVLLPGRASRWTVTFVDTKTGRPCGQREIDAAQRRWTVALPPFTESIAFKAESR